MTLILSIAAAAPASAADDPPAPAADTGAPTTPGPVQLERGYKHRQIPATPITTPDGQPSKPQGVITQVKTAAQKQAHVAQQQGK